MARRAVTEHSRLGAAVLERIKETGVPKSLKEYVTAFARAQSDLKAAETAVNDARAARDAALDRVAAADVALDQSVDVLANRVVGAGLAPRNNAFRGFSKHTPSALKRLPYGKEAREVEKLVSAAGRAKPPAAVKKAAAASASAAASANRALRALTKPQAAYATRLSARDALLPAWKHAYERLRVNAKAAWIDTPAIYKSVFAPPDAVAGTSQPPRAKRRSKSAPKPAASKPAAPVAPKPAVAAASTNGAETADDGGA
jgi:hypothetical protein